MKKIRYTAAVLLLCMAVGTTAPASATSISSNVQESATSTTSEKSTSTTKEENKESSSSDSPEKVYSTLTIRYWDYDPDTPFYETTRKVALGKTTEWELHTFNGWKVTKYAIDYDKDSKEPFEKLDDDQTTIKITAREESHTLDIVYRTLPKESTDTTSSDSSTDTSSTESSTSESSTDTSSTTTETSTTSTDTSTTDSSTADTMTDTSTTDTTEEPTLQAIEANPKLPAGEERTLTTEDLLKYFKYEGADPAISIASHYVYVIDNGQTEVFHEDLASINTNNDILVYTRELAIQQGYRKSEGTSDDKIEEISLLKDGQYDITATKGSEKATITLTVGDLKSVNALPVDSSDTQKNDIPKVTNTANNYTGKTLPKTNEAHNFALFVLGVSLTLLSSALIIKKFI